jgi:hypothetical protein
MYTWCPAPILGNCPPAGAGPPPRPKNVIYSIKFIHLSSVSTVKNSPIRTKSNVIYTSYKEMSINKSKYKGKR